jgi:hypothetical protein
MGWLCCQRRRRSEAAWGRLVVQGLLAWRRGCFCTEAAWENQRRPKFRARWRRMVMLLYQLRRCQQHFHIYGERLQLVHGRLRERLKRLD